MRTAIHSTESSDYKLFRLMFIDQQKLTPRSSAGWMNDDSSTRFELNRLAINRFRDDILHKLLKGYSYSLPQDNLISRALKIPLNMLAPQRRFQILAQYGLGIMPLTSTIQRARKILSEGKTFQGRAFLYHRFLKRSLPVDFDYYDETIDFVLRFLDPSNSSDDYKEIVRVNHKWLSVAHSLGMRQWREIVDYFKNSSARNEVGNLFWMFTKEKLIPHKSELELALKHIKGGFRNHIFDPDIIGARSVARLLKQYGASRSTICKLLINHQRGYEIHNLKTVLEMFEEELRQSSKLDELIDAFGENLWRYEPSRFSFVVDSLKQTKISQCIKFKNLIISNKNILQEMASLLLQDGANTNDLLLCQDLFLMQEDLPHEVVVSKVFHSLRSAPFNLTYEHISQCKTYFCESNTLKEFLDVLVKYGITGTSGVLAFRKAYGVVYEKDLDRLLAIALPALSSDMEKLCLWSIKAYKSHSVYEIEYLSSMFGITDENSLNVIIKYAPLGHSFLRYLVEDKLIDSFKKMREWYDSAMDVKTVKFKDCLSAVDRALIDYAFQKSNFTCTRGNSIIIDGEINNRAVGSLGYVPIKGAQAERDAYWKSRNLYELELDRYIAALLPELLNLTGGIVLPSVLACAIDTPERLGDFITRFEPLFRNIMLCNGPSDSHLSEIEVEAISYVYKVDSNFIRDYWSSVVGQHKHIQQLRVRSYYPMRWQRAEHQLKRPLDTNCLLHCSLAGEFANRFNRYISSDEYIACKKLSPKRLVNYEAADTYSLIQHFGLLLAISRMEDIKIWSDRGFSQLLLLEQESTSAYEALTFLETFFAVTLKDNVIDKLPEFLNSLTEQQAQHIASRISLSSTAESPKTLLKSAIDRSVQLVCSIYGNCVKSELRKFDLEKSNARASQLVSVVTKQPAAFFAKKRVGLCTSGNTAMWKESRQFHLVVFDEEKKQLVGMALIYLEIIDKVSVTVPTLVMRAINPVNEVMGTHDVQSIVRAFFDVAIDIAIENQVCAVALAGGNGMHFLSNNREIEACISKRYFSKAERINARCQFDGDQRSLLDKPKHFTSCFLAYEHGSESLTDLYLIWQAGLKN